MSSTEGTERADSVKPGGNARHLAQHAATKPRHRDARRLAGHAMHPVVHVAGLVTLHVAALGVLDKTPLLALLSLH